MNPMYWRNPDPNLDWRYWWSMIKRDFFYHLIRGRNPAAFTRSMWQYAHSDNVEHCQDCGRRYPSWVAPDLMYEKVHGSRGGQHCIGCFDIRAEKMGIELLWVPHLDSHESFDRMRAICDEIGAFQ
jgi:hypothetical protein